MTIHGYDFLGTQPRVADVAEQLVARLFDLPPGDVQSFLADGSKPQRIFELLDDTDASDDSDTLWDCAVIYMGSGRMWPDMSKAEQAACALIWDQLDTWCTELIEGWNQ